MIIQNKNAQFLWQETFKGKIIHYAIEDLNNDNRKEVIVGLEGQNEDDTDSGKLCVYDCQGEILWYYSPMEDDVTINYPDKNCGKLAVRNFTISPLYDPENKYIIVLYNEAQGWFQSCLILLDADGNRQNIYWHPGHLQNAVIGSGDGSYPRKIIVYGPNNRLRDRYLYPPDNNLNCVFLLDPKDIRGEAPPFGGRTGIGTHEWYGVITPKAGTVNITIDEIQNNIRIDTGLNHVFFVDFSGNILDRLPGDTPQVDVAEFDIVHRNGAYREPDRVEISAMKFTVKDKEGKILWSDRIPGVEEYFIEDIDGDGRKEVRVRVGGRSKYAGRMMVYDYNGTPLDDYHF